MTTALFLSDVHLSAARPDVSLAFQALLEDVGKRCDAVYLLGDIFDAWLGDDISIPEYQEDIDAIKRLSDSGVSVICVYGNHDFTMGKAFEKASGCTLKKEPLLVELATGPAVVMHGDSLCTDDLSYQRYRRVTRSWAFRAFATRLPRFLRFKIADQIRSTSSKMGEKKLAAVTDVTESAVLRCFQENNVATLIHGHTHRPAVHNYPLGETTAKRYVLGDWYTSKTYLLADDRGLKLQDMSQQLV